MNTLNDILKVFARAFKQQFKISLFVIFFCVLGIYTAFSTAAEWETPLALTLLAVLTVYDLLKRMGKTRPGQGKILSWVMWILAFVWLKVPFIPDDIRGGLVALTGTLGLAILCGLRTAPLAAFSLTITLFLLPCQEQWILWISYPLRLVSTLLTVPVFELFGVVIRSEQTSIFIGQTQIAITDACSGVTQLGVFLFFAYLFARNLNGFKQLLLLFFVLPAVIAANTLRLILTVGLFLTAGEVALGETVHVVLGYVFVILALLILWGAACLIPGDEPEKKENA